MLTYFSYSVLLYLTFYNYYFYYRTSRRNKETGFGSGISGHRTCLSSRPRKVLFPTSLSLPLSPLSPSPLSRLPLSFLSHPPLSLPHSPSSPSSLSFPSLHIVTLIGRQVTVVRLIAKDTVEHELYLQNHVHIEEVTTLVRSSSSLLGDFVGVCLFLFSLSSSLFTFLYARTFNGNLVLTNSVCSFILFLFVSPPLYI